MTSIFDKIEQAHDAYLRRHAAAQRLVDDCCQCPTCRSDMAGIAPCDGDQSEPKDQTA